MSAGGKLMEGRERSNAYKFEADQLQQQSDSLKATAAQVEARRREDLTSSLETIAAIRAGRGVGQGSPTAQAIYGQIVEDESRDIRTERVNYLTKAEQSRMASVAAKRKAKTSLIASYIDAGATVANNVAGYMKPTR